MASLEDTYEAIRHGVAARVVARDGVLVEGAAALDWLQGQLSQDLGGLEEGDACLSLVLSPQGKIDALVRVWRTGEERFLLEVEAGFGPALEERLRRFKLRVKATLEVLDLRVLECRGPEAASAAGEGSVETEWGGFVGWDSLLAEGEVPVVVADGDPAAFEAARIEAGVPVLGRELTGRTIPQEAGEELVARTVSFTKGCYTGQELVARLDARGSNVARRLVGVVCESEPAAGDALVAEGTAVAALTSVAWSPGLGSFVALGFARRGVDVPSRADLVAHDGVARPPGRAEMRLLPLVGG